MDLEEMKMMARLRTLLGAAGKEKMDLVRFSQDIDYANAVLADASSSDNEELVLIALQLMQRRGVLGVSPTPVAAPPVVEPPPASPAAPQTPEGKPVKKYLGSLR